MEDKGVPHATFDVGAEAGFKKGDAITEGVDVGEELDVNGKFEVGLGVEGALGAGVGQVIKRKCVLGRGGPGGPGEGEAAFA